MIIHDNYEITRRGHVQFLLQLSRTVSYVQVRTLVMLSSRDDAKNEIARLKREHKERFKDARIIQNGTGKRRTYNVRYELRSEKTELIFDGKRKF